MGSRSLFMSNKPWLQMTNLLLKRQGKWSKQTQWYQLQQSQVICIYLHEKHCQQTVQHLVTQKMKLTYILSIGQLHFSILFSSAHPFYVAGERLVALESKSFLSACAWSPSKYQFSHMLKNANLIRIKTLQVTNQKIRRPYVFVKILTGSESSFSDNFSSSSLRRPISSSLSSFSPPHRVDVGATDVIAKSLSNSLGSCFA